MSYATPLWVTVLVLGVFVICALLLLLLINVRASKKLANEKVCLLYLRLLHLSSAFMVIVIVIKNIGMPESCEHLCVYVNYVYFVTGMFCRIWIYLIWENQYRMVTIAINKIEDSLSCHLALLGGQILVLLPIINLPLDMLYSKTEWVELTKRDSTCVAFTSVWVGDFTMSVELFVNFSFMVLFLVHRSKIRQAARDLKQSLKNKWNDSDISQAAVSACNAAKKLAIRRAIVTFIDTIWLILIYGVVNNIRRNRPISNIVYTKWMLRILQQLSNNTFLYLMLLNRAGSWCFWRTVDADVLEPFSGSYQPNKPRNVQPFRELSTPRLRNAASAVRRLGTRYNTLMTTYTFQSDAYRVTRCLFSFSSGDVNDDFLNSESQLLAGDDLLEFSEKKSSSKIVEQT